METSSLTSGMRNAVRALIVRDGAILVQHKVYSDGRERYTLPGGAADPGETLAEAVIRECEEEIGTQVVVRDLVLVADYWKPRETDPPSFRQQVEMVFRADVPESYEAQNGPHPDRNQKAVVWLPWTELKDSMLTPAGLRDALVPLGPSGTGGGNGPVYLGRIE